MKAALLYSLGAALFLWLLRKAQRRLQLSRAKHRSLGGHSKMAQRVASWLPFHDYDETTFFRADDAPADIAASRQRGFERLAALYAERFPKTLALTRETEGGVTDLQFTRRSRVPFQFSRLVRRPRARSWRPSIQARVNIQAKDQVLY